MAKLYDILGDIATIQALVDDAEDAASDETMQALKDTLEGSNMELSDKIEGICKLIRNMEGNAKMYSDEAAFYSNKAAVEKRKVAGLKKFLKDAMDRFGLTKTNAGAFKVSVQNNGGNLPIIYSTDVKDLPARFKNVSYVADVEAIREYLNEGRKSKYFEYGERGTHLRIG